MPYAGRKAAALAATAWLILVGPLVGAQGVGDDRGADRLARPTLVQLNFRDQPIAEVIRMIGERSGKRVERGWPTMPPVAFGEMPNEFVGDRDPQWPERRINLEAPEPVPFWEAIERLAAAGGVAWRLGAYGSLGAEETGVIISESSPEPDWDEAGGLVQYAGPFRVGLVAVHEHRDRVFVRGPWVQVLPSGVPFPAEAAELATAPPDGGPLYAELRVMAEPGLICRLDGPLRRLEATDAEGRPLLALGAEQARDRSIPWEDDFDDGLSPPVRIPLRRPDAASGSIGRLRGAIPVEIAVVRDEPALVVPLRGTAGRTFRDGGFSVEVREATTDPDGRTRIAATIREEVPDDGSRRPWPTAVLTYQFRIVDAGGREPHSDSGGGGGGEPGEVPIRFEYPFDPVSGAPAELRVYGLERTFWEIPFTFEDVPLP